MSDYRDERKWRKLSIVLWVVWGIMFGVLEWIGLRKGGDGWPPLTYVFKRHVPAILGLGLTGWLLFHAMQTYLGWFGG